MSKWICTVEGCGRGPATGHALHRTSPKGQPFKGNCTEHHDNPEPVAVLIETANQRKGNPGGQR